MTDARKLSLVEALGLEPLVGKIDYHMSGDTVILASIAISLRRIADALEAEPDPPK